MSRLHNGSITLVGAGPGDPELITVKAIRLIRQATVILYDALVHQDLLKYNTQAEQIYVGKRAGRHSMKQAEINQLLVELALEGAHVVRLKGGDAMVFGRAAEELSYARLFGIPTQVVPGISAYAGIAASLQIPITQRCVAESFWVTTGVTCRGTLSDDIDLAAQSSATVIVFMGLSRLPEIVALFLQYKPATHPVAIIQNGTLPNEKSVVGTLDNIIAKAQQAEIAAPAILLFGSCVASELAQFHEIIHTYAITTK